MKILYKTILAIVCISILSACSDYLENTPSSVLEESELISAENIDGFVTSAYAALGNDHYDAPFSLWPYGNVRSDDAYKGGSGTNDIQVFHFFEVSNNIRTDFGELDAFWYNSYIAISRVNKAINALNQIDQSEYALKDTRLSEMYFLRGHFYFMLKVMFKYVPYITEQVPIEEYGNISNRDLSNDELWEAIAQDFEKATANLPEHQDQIGRVTKSAGFSYLSKVRLYQAYEQDENNNVTNINPQRLQEVITATDRVLGKYVLESDFGFNFLPGSYENGTESVFSIQFSHDDNTLHGRLNFSDVLATPQGLGCCDFHKPSQNLVNAFKTNNDGLPMLNDFNNTDVDYSNLDSFTVDPRLYHTVAIPGLPFKYNESSIYMEDWNRSPSTYGYYASLKENVSPDCDCFVNIDPFYGNSKNRIQIRYSDVLLIRAEALIELGRHKEALPLINQIRERASQSTTLIDGYATNTSVALYQDGVNCNWTQDFARKALRFERRLEFAMEGSRFFDLVRWGVADKVLNTFYDAEKDKRIYYTEAHFDASAEEYCPIPLAQINFSRNVYKQNVGY